MAELVDMGVVVELVEVVDLEAGRRQVETQAREVVVVGGGGGRNGARTPGGLSSPGLDISNVTLILMFSEMVERGGYTSLDLLDGDCVLRPQVLLRYLRLSFLYGWCILMLPNSKFPPRV